MEKEVLNNELKSFLRTERSIASLTGHCVTGRYLKILLHVPHSSAVFPEEVFVGGAPPRVNEVEGSMTDWFTDELFVPQSACEEIVPVVFPFSRLYCDVERMENDPLEEQGLGIVYNYGGRCFHPSRLTVCHAMEMYAEHTRKVARLLGSMRNPLLLDCHSFSSLPNPLRPNVEDALQTDICIGVNDTQRPTESMLAMICNYFEDNGYRVNINKPFANSKTVPMEPPCNYWYAWREGRVVEVKAFPAPYDTLMIEVNKRLYMDETTGEKSKGFDKLRKTIQMLYPKLLEDRSLGS